MRQEMVKFAQTKAKLSQRDRKLAMPTEEEIKSFIVPNIQMQSD